MKLARFHGIMALLSAPVTFWSTFMVSAGLASFEHSALATLVFLCGSLSAASALDLGIKLLINGKYK